MKAPRGGVKQATCHPERKAYAHGKCENCYKRHRYHHKPGEREANIRRAQATRARDPQAWRRRQVAREYGLPWAEYLAMEADQGGLCAICRKAPGARGFHVDHCHSTKRIRGLLCSPCNTALGGFKDDGPTMLRAIRYLRAETALVYVAGPYTADPERCTHTAMDVADALEDAGVVTFTPHLSHFRHLRRARDYEHWMRVDLLWLSRCDALLRLEGESSGADREVAFANAHGIPVFTSVDGVIAWANR